MKYYNSAAIIRTKKGNTVGVHLIVAEGYRKNGGISFSEKDSVECDYFEICEFVGGSLLIETHANTKVAKVEIKHKIEIKNAETIEILSVLDL